MDELEPSKKSDQMMDQTKSNKIQTKSESSNSNIVSIKAIIQIK